MAPLMMPLERTERWSRTELYVAVIALLFLLAAKPALGQSNQNPNLNPPATTSEATHEKPIKIQHRKARRQPQPECKADDSVCIEQRNRLNPNTESMAPTFNR